MCVAVTGEHVSQWCILKGWKDDKADEVNSKHLQVPDNKKDENHWKAFANRCRMLSNPMSDFARFPHLKSHGNPLSSCEKSGGLFSDGMFSVWEKTRETTRTKQCPGSVDAQIGDGFRS